MKFFAYLAVCAIRTFVDAWALLTLWRWFVLPLGAPDITFWHAAGLDVFVGLFFCVSQKPAGSDDEQLGWMAGKTVGVILTVGFGWLFHAAMTA